MMDFSQYIDIVHQTKADRIKGDKLYAFSRFLSVRLSYVLLRLFPAISPNHVSFTMILLVLIAIALNLFHGFFNPVFLVFLQIILIQLAAIGDRVDGEIARYKSFFTQKGVYYDRVFHFLYPFALYLSVGVFFAEIMGLSKITLVAIILAIIAALASNIPKLRHHIKYKIELEKHEGIVQDLYTEKATNSTKNVVVRIGKYFIFMMYDWVWGLYCLLIVLSLYDANVAVIGYLIHASISIMAMLVFVLRTYPKHGLFSKADFSL